MIKKTCPGCGKVIDRKYPLCPECTIRMTSKRNKAYNAVTRNKGHDAIYQDKRWRIIKPIVRRRDMDRCRLCFEAHRFTDMQMVHHIVEPEDNNSLAYEPDNLICLCESCHQHVHKAYKDGNKLTMQDKLRTLVKTPIKV